MSPTDGFVIVDKPQGKTSHDVVNTLRKFFNTRAIGHAGTLDPMATGILVLGVNKATRLLTFCVGDDKTYSATIRLGESTDTDDATGKIIDKSSIAKLTKNDIEKAIIEFIGEIEQIPSTYSAIKIKGKKAYELARQGEAVELKPRKVTIKKFDLLNYLPNQDTIDLEVLVECSSGTYIRALARDLGAKLNTGAHLTKLHRKQSGRFSESDVTELTNPKIIPLVEVAKLLFPIIQITQEQAKDLSQGRKVLLASEQSQLQAAIDPQDQLIALVEKQEDKIAPKLVFGESI